MPDLHPNQQQACGQHVPLVQPLSQSLWVYELMLSLAKFTERYGDPNAFVFKGQCYDAGVHLSKCRVCGRRIRDVYVLKTPDGRSVPLGVCCFHFFENNKDLHDRLLAAWLWLDTSKVATKRDITYYKGKVAIRERARLYKGLRREALAKIRDYKKNTGKEWLPETLFELQEEVSLRPTAKQPTAVLRWYDQHIVSLQQKINR
jgi:hypothetical protein